MSRSSETEGWKEKQNLKLLLVGDGDEKENLLHQIENYQSKENILFLGRRTDVPKLLKISNLFVLPTLFEGQSNAIMEAMATGLPVITTDIPENRSLLENNYSGILVPIQDSYNINGAISKLANEPDLRIKLGNNAHNKIRSRYSLMSIALIWKYFLNTISY